MIPSMIVSGGPYMLSKKARKGRERKEIRKREENIPWGDPWTMS